MSIHSKLQTRLFEAFDQLYDSFVDPSEAYTNDGLPWNPVGAFGQAQKGAPASIANEAALAEVREQCRRLANNNEFAINGHENRISYIVGSGHRYRMNVRKGSDAPDEVALEAQKVLEEFLHENQWQERQQEIVRRVDRDGEAFLRFFVDSNGITRIRAIEPDQVFSPQNVVVNATSQFGIETDPNDVETVYGYWVDGVLVDASEIQHRKANVDRNVRRGLPLYYPVRKNLNRAEKLLRNMSVVAEIQSAIALIRKHGAASASGVEQFVSAQASTVQNSRTGQSRYLSQYQPGTILDAPAGLEYDFPAKAIDAGQFVTVLQAELRAIASRLVMPEFMFTSDASNANYASSLVAEGPAIKMFERLQATAMLHDCDVMWRVLVNAATVGRLPSNIRELVDLHITPPGLSERDYFRDSKVDKIAYDSGILSPQTWSERLGLNYDQEQKNIAMQK